MAKSSKGKIFKTILFVIGASIAAFLVVASMQPDDFRYSRSATIHAPAEDIFPQVNNLKKFNEWNPWADLDPNAKGAFEGPEEGVGAKMSWDGNYKVGKGSMTTMESRLNTFIQFRMDFEKPMASTSTAEFTFTPEGEGTVVTWSMYGKNNFIGKAMGLIFNCEKMVSEQFDKGLANLKGIAEKTTQKPS